MVIIKQKNVTQTKKTVFCHIKDSFKPHCNNVPLSTLSQFISLTAQVSLRQMSPLLSRH